MTFDIHVQAGRSGFFYDTHNQGSVATCARKRMGALALFFFFISVCALGEGERNLICTFVLWLPLSTLAPSKARHLVPEH